MNTDIRRVIDELNSIAEDFEIGGLQELRKAVHGLGVIKKGAVFTTPSADGTAYHYGGRRELQFNVGYEADGRFRYGVAFCLKRSMNLTDYRDMLPKIAMLNRLIVEKPRFFKDCVMFHSNKTERSDPEAVHEIPPAWQAEGEYIFIGKYMSADEIDYDEILCTLDSLLPVYEAVETNDPSWAGQHWSRELRELTRNELTGGRCAFGACMKNLDGRFGIMGRDADGNFVISDREGTWRESFPTPDILIQSGWALD
jgi:hypothetical protein